MFFLFLKIGHSVNCITSLLKGVITWTNNNQHIDYTINPFDLFPFFITIQLLQMIFFLEKDPYMNCVK